MKITTVLLAVCLVCPDVIRARADQTAAAEHAQIGVVESGPSNQHNRHPDAQWFPDAGLGLFIHWDEGSVAGLETSWPMMAGRGRTWNTERKLSKEPWKLSPAEFERIVREKDFGQGTNQFTPNQYWALAGRFNPAHFHPEVWLKQAKAAGFVYAVFTAKHHSGFAMWPSAYGGFSTRDTPMQGRDLVKEYVAACRAAGLKVGLYYSGPDWHFNRDYQNFLYSYGGLAKSHPELELDADHNRRTGTHTVEELTAHQKAFAEMERGQLTELLTHYGKIDILWFDGKPPIPDPDTTVMSLLEIRRLQPGIVVNNRFHRHGDFITPESNLPAQLHLRANEWGEYNFTWGYGWSYTGWKCRPLNEILGNVARGRAAGVNNLVDVGPTADGELPPDIQQNIDQLGRWMQVNGESIHGTRALPENERATVPAVSKGAVRYLYLLPDRSLSGPQQVSLNGLETTCYQAHILGDRRMLPVTAGDHRVTVTVPAPTPNQAVRVVKLFPGKG